jgi:hypothetical protein
MNIRIYARTAARFLLALVGVGSFSVNPTHAQTFDLDAGRIPITQVDSAWRFHLGDDPNWAQPGDGSWPVLHPEDSWTTQGYPAKTELAWFRFRLHAPAHTATLALDLPGIEKSFQIFCDGELMAKWAHCRPVRRTTLSAARASSCCRSTPARLRRTLLSRFVCGRIQLQPVRRGARSEEHTSELQSLACISYAVFCLKKKKKQH